MDLYPATRVFLDKDTGHVSCGRLVARGLISQARLGEDRDGKAAKGKGTRRPKPEEEDWGGPRRWGRVARKSGKSDRSRIAGMEPYEIYYVARKYGVSADAVRKVVKRVGTSRRRVEKVLERESKTQ